MYLFHNDYNEICHPAILERMRETANAQMNGYGEDECCGRAVDKIRRCCGREDLAVHFLVGGTQSNMIVIASALRPHQAVLAPASGHIHVHETAAIEATGHKVLPLASSDGKITAEQIASAVDAHWADATHEHMPQPKMVYISQPTEFGTTYSYQELSEISQVCQQKGLYLFVDGARLGYALAAGDNDVDLAALAELTDVFYIGGTKVGAMFGEAVVIRNPALQADFRYIMKQRGGMLAKGWLLGLQFDVLFENELYWKIAHSADVLADQIRDTIHSLGYSMPVCSRTNQVFAVLPNTLCKALEKEFSYSPWERVDNDHTMVRFCTSWATTRDSVDALCNALKNFSCS